MPNCGDSQHFRAVPALETHWTLSDIKFNKHPQQNRGIRHPTLPSPTSPLHTLLSKMAATAPNRLRYVDHTYRDFSHYIEEGGELVKHKKSSNNFPARLHRMLSKEEHSGEEVHRLICSPSTRAYTISASSPPLLTDVITWMVSSQAPHIVAPGFQQ